MKKLTLGIVFTSALSAAQANADAAFVRDGRAGFVVSDFAFSLGPDAAESGACPQGLSRNPMEIFALQTGARRRANESEEAFAKRLQAGAKVLSTAANGQNLCLHPEAGSPDPYFKTVQGNDIAVPGLDLDGASGPEDFRGGIDNQFYRVVGCSRSYQSTGQSNGFAIEMLTGSWGIVLELSGVDDIRNDPEVTVAIAANADPIQLSTTREPLAYATYAKDQDPRFRALTRGQIVNGVLTTEPVTVRFHSVVNSMQLERPLHEARIRATLSEGGTLDGFLAGYTPVDAMYDMQYGYRNGKTASGELAPLALRMGSSNGAASVLGHTCHGAYYALREHADAMPDPDSGRFTAISTQYRFRAIPAFVVDIETEGGNAGIKQSVEYRNDY